MLIKFNRNLVVDSIFLQILFLEREIFKQKLYKLYNKDIFS